MCAAPKGNEFWKLRSKHGRDTIIKSPEILWQSAQEYFQNVSDNPIEAYDNKGTKNVNLIKFLRPFTQKGFCIFLDISEDAYRDLKIKDDFSEVTRRIDAIIYNQKFEGATIGIFNHNIIARDLGLIEKKDTSTKIIREFSDKTDEQLRDELKRLIDFEGM